MDDENDVDMSIASDNENDMDMSITFKKNGKDWLPFIQKYLIERYPRKLLQTLALPNLIASILSSS